MRSSQIGIRSRDFFMALGLIAAPLVLHYR